MARVLLCAAAALLVILGTLGCEPSSGDGEPGSKQPAAESPDRTSTAESIPQPVVKEVPQPRSAKPPPAEATPDPVLVEFESRERTAAGDVPALLALAGWAKERNLARERQRTLLEVLKLAPDNPQANAALGRVLHEGEWISKAKADLRRRQARAQASEGFVEVEGIRVEQAHLVDAKRGVFHHGGELVTKLEKQAMLSGMARHPRTGALIPANDLPKAQAGRFPVEAGWQDLAAADRFHADASHPWIYRTRYCTLVSTLPLQKLEELKYSADFGVEAAQLVLGTTLPSPPHRPTIFVASNNAQFIKFGDDYGAEESAYSVFLGSNEVSLPDIGSVRPVFTAYANDNWRYYWMRHAAAMAFAAGRAGELGAQLPLWFRTGTGSVAQYHCNAEVQHPAARSLLDGGFPGKPEDWNKWFPDFAFRPNVPWQQHDSKVKQAGLVIDFARRGGDAEAAEALRKVADAKDAPNLEATLKEFELVLGGKGQEIAAWLAKIAK